jgi:hypothetical protein
MLPQLVVSGLALGSIYALLALSLVLINKATDVVNTGQLEWHVATAIRPTIRSHCDHPQSLSGLHHRSGRI